MVYFLVVFNKTVFAFKTLQPKNHILYDRQKKNDKLPDLIDKLNHSLLINVIKKKAAGIHQTAFYYYYSPCTSLIQCTS